MRHAASRLFAGLHTAAADIGADAAMRVLVRMFLAFVGAEPASGYASVQHAADHLVIPARLARSHSAGDIADVGAIEVEADALRQRIDHLLREASVSARGADLRAGITLLDAADEQAIATRSRVVTDHFLDLHGTLRSFEVFLVRPIAGVRQGSPAPPLSLSGGAASHSRVYH
jgi:hypothetical protein